MLPIIMRIHIKERGRNKIKLFFPVILIWIVVFALFVVLAPLALIIALLLWPSGHGNRLLLIGPLLFSLLCSLSGLGVFIEKRDEKILITAN